MENFIYNRVTFGFVFLGLLFTFDIASAEKGDLEIDSFLDQYTTIWNMHDGDALAALFTTDSDLIMGSLPRIAGRESIGRWWNMYFSRIDENRNGEFKLLSYREIAPDVRIVNISSKTSGTNKSGDVLEARYARGTWILVRRNGIWLIEAMRGLPVEGEQRFRPGEDH